MHKRSELFFNVLLVPLDFLMVIVSFVAAYLIRTRLVEGPIAFHPGVTGYFELLLIVAPIWIFTFAVLGLYSFHADRSRFQELGRVTVAVASAVMALIVWEYVSREPVFPSRSIPIYALGLGILFVYTGRLIVWMIQRSFFSRGIGVHRLLLVGNHRNAEILAGELTDRRSGQEIVGLLDDHAKQGTKVAGVEVLGRISEIERVVSRRHIDEIIVTDSELPESLIFSLIAYADAKKLSFRYAPTLFGVYNINTHVSQLAGIPLVELRKTSLEGWGRVQKRLFDLAGVLMGGLLISPLLLIIALLIKLDSPGPVFYRHRRIGRGGRPFEVLKFRTMKTEYSTGGKFSGMTDEEIFKRHFKNGAKLYEEFQQNQKLESDPRVTRMGSFLRRTSLDELPQLWNVLKGEMTLVGPRPVTERELPLYAQYQHMVLSLKPGMTGLWQVSGRSDVSYEERVRLDSYYVENWSLWLDIQTILRTIKVLIQRRGAY
jgi:exopolysaccharide biosynthesis polyprenyl glycosylphosphotransferase